MARLYHDMHKKVEKQGKKENKNIITMLHHMIFTYLDNLKK